MTVLIVTEEPVVVEKESLEAWRVETERVEAHVIVLVTSNLPSSVETVRGLV